MLLSLVSSALALTVPLKATFSEQVVPGESTLASSALTATVALSNPDTGVDFIVGKDELTVNKREASGKGGLSFSGNPANSIRTWAVYYLAANGDKIGDPEVVDVLFDKEGNGAIAARDGVGFTRLVTISGINEVVGETWSANAKVVVSDGGVQAALIGIVELTNDGGDASRLRADPDMEIMDAAAFAAYQGIGLDAMIALDTYKVQLEGDLSVDGLTVATDGTVENGADLRWDLALYDGNSILTCSKERTCETTSRPTGTVSYTSEIGSIKKKKTSPPTVTLKPAELTYDSWDAGFSFAIEGDVRDLELAASLDVLREGKPMSASDVVSLDPGGFGVEAALGDDDDDDDSTPIVDIFIDGDCDDCGDYDYTVPNPSNPPAWTVIADELIDVSVYDSGGGLVSTHECTLAPTVRTLAGTAKRNTLVGECTRDTAGTEVRRLVAYVGEKGGSIWSIDMAGSAFAASKASGECAKLGGCTDSSVSVLGGSIDLAVRGTTFFHQSIDITSTEFDLPFAFTSDVDGEDVALVIELLDPNREISWKAEENILWGQWKGEYIYQIDLDGLSTTQTGIYALKGGKEWSVLSLNPLLIEADTDTVRRSGG